MSSMGCVRGRGNILDLRRSREIKRSRMCGSSDRLGLRSGSARMFGRMCALYLVLDSWRRIHLPLGCLRRLDHVVALLCCHRVPSACELYWIT